MTPPVLRRLFSSKFNPLMGILVAMGLATGKGNIYTLAREGTLVGQLPRPAPSCPVLSRTTS